MNRSVLIQQANHLVKACIADIQGSFLPLGPAYSGPDFRVSDLVRYRMCKKWYEPDPSTEKLRFERTLNAWETLELKLADWKFSPSPTARWTCMRASMLLHNKLRERDFSWNNSTEFTPGESYYSSRGFTSVRQKLKRLKHWTVTYEAADEAASLCWNNSALRACALEHMTNECPDDLNKLLYGVEVSEQFAFFVLCVKTHLFRYVNGARLAQVPKDSRINRAINVEPTFNMLLQRQLSAYLRSRLERFGNDLETGQAKHRSRLADPTISTIDFSSASDSHILAAFEMMFPHWLVSKIKAVRSCMTKLPDGREVWNYKLSSMGNGFTFEVMTWLLLSLARVHDADASVYGDDVIIRNSCAQDFICAAESLGWVINHEKTFVNSRFRESCGGFYHDTYGYIVSYDFWYCKTVTDVVTTANKLRHILTKLDCPRLHALWDDLVALCPAWLKGPASEYGTFYDVNSRYIEVPHFERAHRRNKDAVKLFTKTRVLREAIEQCVQERVVCVIRSPRIEGRILWDASRHVGGTFELYSVLSGLSKDRCRTDRTERFQTHFVTESGNLLTLNVANKFVRQLKQQQGR